MKKLFLILLLGVAVTYAFAADDISQFPSCKYCGMHRDVFNFSRMLIEYNDGKAEGFCSIHCAAVDLAVNIDRSPVRILVGDYGTKELIDAETALWIIGGSKPGVMTKRAKWAFKTQADADKFVKEFGGVQGPFDTAMAATYEDMYQDSKMIRERRAMKEKRWNRGNPWSTNIKTLSLPGPDGMAPAGQLFHGNEKVERREFLRIISCAGLAFILPQCRSGPLKAGDVAPELAVVDLTGKKLTLPGAFKGKVVLLHFWASWCRNCISEMRDLQAIYDQYGSRGVVPCSVSIGDTKEAVDEYLRDVQVTYPILVDGKAASKKLYGISGVPTTYGLNRQGIIGFRFLGPVGKEAQERFLKTLL